MAISPDMLVLDVGSGSFPNPRSDILCERDLVDDRHRGGLAVTIDRPLVRADALVLPFRDGGVDFVIASHIAEHVDDPVLFCAELGRVAKAGYVETPSPLFEALFDVEYHSWRVSVEGGVLTFTPKRPRPWWLRALSAPAYLVYFADQPSPGRRTLRIPAGRVGDAMRFALRATFALVNRSGAFHTRCAFQPGQPLRCRVVEPKP